MQSFAIKFSSYFYLFLILIFLLVFWVRGGLDTVYLDTDLARDLTQLSNIWLGRVVWLGPWLSLGFNTSPLYYYLNYPFLWLSGGSAYSLIAGNLLLAAASLFLFGYFLIKKFGKKGLLPVAIIGVSDWWQIVVMHPGNGFSYTIWLFLAITSLYFAGTLFLSSIFLGIAISFHPAALVALPLLFYEWSTKDKRALNLFKISAGLLIAWVPIIIFEFITKGFLFRQFLANFHTTEKFRFNFEFLQQMGALLPLFLIITVFANNRLKKWAVFFLISLLAFILPEKVLSYYLLGAVCVLSFISLLVVLEQQFALVILVPALLLFFGTSLLHPPKQAERTISKIEKVADLVSEKNLVDKRKNIAVVAALSEGTAVPQADDYRFFLRMKGYKILEVSQYSKADNLLMFVENPQFDWKNWSTWETDQFGKRKVLKEMDFNGIKAIIFEKS